MAELALAVRRSILLTLLLAVGALAAALVIRFFAALFLAARWGSRGPLAPQAHLFELAEVAASVTALLLPALLAGMTPTETEALATLAQTAIGWKRPIAALLLGCCLLGATYLIARLKSSVKEERLAGQSLVWLSALVLLALMGVSAWRLAEIPASAGLEMLEKKALMLALLTIGVAACSPGNRGGRGIDLRRVACVAGFLLAGALLHFGTSSYLRPGLEDIDRVLGTSGDANGTMFAASLQGRPDLYGLFSLQVASGTPRLEVVRPIGTSIDQMIEKVVPTWFGSARLEPQPDFVRIPSVPRAPPLEERFEVRFRLNGWPRLDLPWSSGGPWSRGIRRLGNGAGWRTASRPSPARRTTPR